MRADLDIKKTDLSYLNADGEEYMNAFGDKLKGLLNKDQKKSTTSTSSSGDKISEQDVNDILATLDKASNSYKQVKGMLQSDSMRKEIRMSCGMKPLFGKDKKERWAKCAQEYMLRKAAAGGSSSSYAAPTPIDQSGQPSSSTTSNKIFGMEPATFAIVAVGVVGIGLYLVFKRS
jgi:hypothetical protein